MQCGRKEGMGEGSRQCDVGERRMRVGKELV